MHEMWFEMNGNPPLIGIVAGAALLINMSLVGYYEFKDNDAAVMKHLLWSIFYLLCLLVGMCASRGS